MAALAGDDIEQAYARYFPILREKCARMLGDAAEAQDVAQEAFTRLWTERERIRDHGAIAGWLYRTSTRLAIERIRRRGRIAQGVDPALLPPGDHTTPERRLHVCRMLDAIARRASAAELEVGILSRLDGLTHPEIAEVTGRGERTVRRLLTKLDERLAKIDSGGSS